MNFWSSWKRNHKTHDYDQQSVITAERIRPILKEPDPTLPLSGLFDGEGDVTQHNPNTFSVRIGLRKHSAGHCPHMTDIHRWRAGGTDFHLAVCHSTRQILLGKQPPAAGSGLGTPKNKFSLAVTALWKLAAFLFACLPLAMVVKGKRPQYPTFFPSGEFSVQRVSFVLLWNLRSCHVEEINAFLMWEYNSWVFLAVIWLDVKVV